MPGENCAIFGCSTSRRNKGISFFKVPLANSEVNKAWGNELINIITKDREIDASLRTRINSRKLFICELHFSPQQYYVYESKKSLKEGEIPTLNLPCKSISKPSSSTTSRSVSSIQKRDEYQQVIPSQTTFVYKNFFEFVNRIGKLSLGNCWKIKIHDTFASISYVSQEYVLPKFEIYVDNSLSFSLRIFGWMLSDDHELYSIFKRSFENVTLSNFILKLNEYDICKGIDVPDPKKYFSTQIHVLSKVFDYNDYQLLQFKPRLCQDVYYRSNICKVMIKSDKKSCLHCCSAHHQINSSVNRKSSVSSQPAKKNAPVKFTSPGRLKLTLQANRLKCKQLEEEIIKMRSAIKEHGEKVDFQLNNDFRQLFSGCEKSAVPDFMKLLWDEQQKYLQSSHSSSVRYHPMIIKFCLNLASKSSSAYSDLRYDKKTGNGILVLPSLRTLRNYKNYIHPTRGFNPAVINDLADKTVNFSAPERFVFIIFDEMKVQEDLVWDKHSGELIGFVDLGDITINYATLKKVEQLATHVLVFLVKSIVNPLSFSFASFATTGVSCDQIMPIFWKAVCYLENIDLHVISATADGAASNRRFFRMHKFLQGEGVSDVIYRTRNIYSIEHRYIYFFADVPHLIKTARNCLSNSGAGRSTRYMWNDGFHLLWSHIAAIYNEQLESDLKFVPKLTNDHIHLTSYSVMRVNLAAQVLSDTVGKVLSEFGPPEAAGTARFCLMMDKFLDCLNVRNTVEHELKRKPFLKPYTDCSDERFSWLDTFLEYFSLWKESVENRPGNFSQTAKSKMFISWQTHEGIEVTVNSFKEVVRYLLENGVKYVLSERFCQDDLENYFGRQRAIGRRKDNPSIRDVGFNDNTIKSQFSVRPIAGNVRDGLGKFNVIDETPLPKRKK